MELGLRDRVILVTGGAKGIGAGVARVLAAEGAIPVIVGRSAADNATVRTVFVVGPDKKIKLQLSYPMSTGRNFDEILRVIDSIQLTAQHKVATPVNWKPGDDVIITAAVAMSGITGDVDEAQSHLERRLAAVTARAGLLPQTGILWIRAATWE